MTIKNKIKLSLAIFIILCICLVALVILPFLKEIKNNSAGIISQKQNFNSLLAREEISNNFKNRHREIEPNLEKINNIFVDAETPIDFIHFLEKTFSGCDAYLNISPGIASKPADGSWFFLNFQLTSISSFPNFLKLLEKLENNQYLIEVQNISIKKLTQAEVVSLQKENKNLSFDAVEVDFSLGVLAK